MDAVIDKDKEALVRQIDIENSGAVVRFVIISASLQAMDRIWQAFEECLYLIAVDDHAERAKSGQLDHSTSV
uniref:TIR domain-containing protein n=1 Tax=Angiostrongylus cantonensis TaxID=6313 RepID=A0A0K0D797_ANGCA